LLQAFSDIADPEADQSQAFGHRHLQVVDLEKTLAKGLPEIVKEYYDE
jgi:hypothetical protein